MRGHPEMQEYYRVEPHQRLILGVLYFGLAVLARARHARDARASQPSDGRQTDPLRREKTEDLEQDIALIAQEFREGFQAVDRIDQPAVTIFGSALSGGTRPLYAEARAAGRRFAELGWAVVTGAGPE